MFENNIYNLFNEIHSNISYGYEEFINNIIPYINKFIFINDIEYNPPYKPYKLYTPFIKLKANITPIKEFRNGRDEWGICISIKVKEKYIPDEWFNSSYEQRKSKRLHSLSFLIKECDNYIYKENLTIFCSYKWVYVVKYFICPHNTSYDEVIITNKELDRFKDRIRNSISVGKHIED